MLHDYNFGAIGNFSFKLSRIDVIRPWVDVHVDWSRPHTENRAGHCDTRKAGYENLVPGLNIQRPKQRIQCYSSSVEVEGVLWREKLHKCTRPLRTLFP